MIKKEQKKKKSTDHRQENDSSEKEQGLVLPFISLKSLSQILASILKKSKEEYILAKLKSQTNLSPEGKSKEAHLEVRGPA